MPQMNPDGTVQVAPPTQSAFQQPLGQQFGQPQAAPAAPVVHAGTPGPAGAINDLVAMLARLFAPKSITQAGVREQDAEREAQ